MSLDTSRLYSELEHCRYTDQIRLKKKLRNVQKIKQDEQKNKALKQLEADIASAQALLRARHSVPLSISFPPQLPVSQNAADIVESIKNNQIVIVAGETGSGKTTQLPKICLLAGLGRKGLIGHTQPRRLAARTVSTRIAEELNVELGEAVGYQVRFTDQSSASTLVKVMTDGILLSEIKHDPYLNKYDALIIDEAHERSLNIDFLLGYLKRLLSKRPTLKLIITSATIDVARFSAYFSNAPVFSVTGRSYPVEVIYRPANLADEYSQTLSDQISDVVEEIIAEEKSRQWQTGDILVFLPGEREIREISNQLKERDWRDTEVLPLYARLGNKDQNRIFSSHAGRRIVLSTNVAETSITVPGIRYVIDPGTVRISRYSYRSKIQRLPIESISQASANQRKGRCGRIAEGICYRLYSEDDFLTRPEFTDPEILRTNLAAVILKMIDSGIGSVDDFEFIDPPDNRLWNDGYKLLYELKAVDESRKLSPLGKRLASLPTDPRLGKMLLSAADNNCLKEVLIIVSGLSIQDPRERPADKKQAADQAHSEYKDPDSDFLSFTKLWDLYEVKRQELSNNQQKRFCQKNYLSFMRMREWREIHRQLHLVLKDLGLKEQDSDASYEVIHQSLLSGLLGNVGRHDEKREYQGCRNRKFLLFPGSGVSKKRPKWLFSAEIVETQHVYARCNAKIDPVWIEPLAGHLINKTWSEPHWQAKRAQVIAKEKVTLYGLEIIANRPINYGPIDPVVSRDIFIRTGIVEQEYTGRAFPIQQNRELIKQLESIEDRTRKRDIVVDDEVVYALYDQKIPSHVVGGTSFERWFKKCSKDEQDLLCFSKEDLVRQNASEFDVSLFPDHLENNGIQFPLSYQFDPATETDGVTISVPVNAVRQLTAGKLEMLVPGLLREKCIQLIKNLPRTLRRNFVPVPDIVDRMLPRIELSTLPLLETLAHELKRQTTCVVPIDAWNFELLEKHLRFNIQVIDDHGKVIEQGRDLLSVVDKVEHLIQEASAEVEKDKPASLKATAWDFGKLERSIVVEKAGIKMTQFPALQDQNSCVEKVVCIDELKAGRLNRMGVSRLISFRLEAQINTFKKEIKPYKQMGLLYAPVGQAKYLYDDFLMALIANHFLTGELIPQTKAEFESLLDLKRADFMPQATLFAELVFEIIDAYHKIMKKLKGKLNLALAMPMSDLQQQLNHLVYNGFLCETPLDRLRSFPRYLNASLVRFEKMARDMPNERRYVPILNEWWEQYAQRKKQFETQGVWVEELADFRWLIEEQRVSWYAQNLGTSETVSPKRINKVWESIRR